MVEDSQDHPEGHVGDPQDDRHLHLEGVEEAQVIDSQAPDLGWQERWVSCRGPPVHVTLTHLFVPFRASAQSVTCPPLKGNRGDWLRAQTTQSQPQLFLTG